MSAWHCMNFGLPILLFIWNKNAHLIRLIGKNPAVQSSYSATRTYTIIWILVAAFIVFGGLISSFLIYRQNKLFENRTQWQNQENTRAVGINSVDPEKQYGNADEQSIG